MIFCGSKKQATFYMQSEFSPENMFCSSIILGKGLVPQTKNEKQSENFRRGAELKHSSLML